MHPLKLFVVFPSLSFVSFPIFLCFLQFPSDLYGLVSYFTSSISDELRQIFLSFLHFSRGQRLATTSFDTSKILRRGALSFLLFFGFPLRSTVFRCFQTALSRWGSVHQIRMIFFSCVSPDPTIIGVNRWKIHLNTMVFIEIISHTQPSASMREFYRHVVMRTPWRMHPLTTHDNLFPNF